MTKAYAFTKRSFEQLTIEDKRYRVKDCGHRDSVKGLVLEVLPSGNFVFRFRRKRLGRDISVTIGEFPGISIENARKCAQRIAMEIAEGKNPNEVKQQQKLEREKELALSMSLQQLFDGFESEFYLKIKSGERREKSLRDIQATWRNHLKPRVGNLMIEAISSVDANQLLKSIFSQSSVSIRNKSLTLMKSMYSEQDFNPFAGIKKLREEKRARTLSKQEVAALLEALNHEEPDRRDVVITLLITGQRKSCVFSMEWAEVDYEQGIWIIPATKMKVKKAHAVPLTAEMLDILKRRSKEAEIGEKYVFPSSRSKSGHVSEKSGKGSFWWRITERAGLRSAEKGESVTIHDLRRTLASWNMTRGGSIQVTSKLLAHSDISITASTYAHLDVEPIRKELGMTAALLLGSDMKESKVDRLVKEIKQLSEEERRELLEKVSLGYYNYI